MKSYSEQRLRKLDSLLIYRGATELDEALYQIVACASAKETA
jgi:hypothetical protein